MATARAAARQKRHLPLTRSGIAIILMAFTSAFVCGFCFWTGWANDAERLPAILEQDVTIELDLIGDPARRDYGYVSNAQMGDGPDAIRVRVIWPKDNEGLSPDIGLRSREASGT